MNYGQVPNNTGFNMNSIGVPNPMQTQFDRYMNLTNQQQGQQGNGGNGFNFNNVPMQQSQQPMMNNTTNVNWVVVENWQKAKEQIVPNNSTVWMRDSSEPFIYVKIVDNLGTPNFKILKTEDVTDAILNNNGNIQTQQNFQPEGFVPVENFNELVNKFGTLNDTVGSLQQKINFYEQMFSQQLAPKSPVVQEISEPIVTEKPKVGRPQKVGE